MLVYITNLNQELSHIGNCRETVLHVFKKVYGRPLNLGLDEVSVGIDHGYETTDLSLSDYCISKVREELESQSLCIIGLSDDTVDHFLGHFFVLFQIGDKYYRMESYAEYVNEEIWTPFPKYRTLYTNKLTEWDNWEHELKDLLDTNDEPRLSLWNKLFCCNEDETKDDFLYLSIYKC